MVFQQYISSASAIVCAQWVTWSSVKATTAGKHFSQNWQLAPVWVQGFEGEETPRTRGERKKLRKTGE